MAKGGSKNDAKNRKKAQQFLIDGKPIRPVKLIGINSTYMGAEYIDAPARGAGRQTSEYKSAELVLSDKGEPLTWSSARSLATLQ